MTHGKSNLDAMRTVSEACIHCGLCLPVCPTYRETGSEVESPRGRIYLVRGLLENRLEPGPDVNEHLDACVGCRACETACPAGVEYGHLLELARAQFVEPHRRRGLRTAFWRPMIRHVLTDPKRLKAALLPAKLARKALLKAGKTPAWLPEMFARPLDVLPEPQPGDRLPEWTPAVGAERGVVAFLEGCAMPVLYAGVNAASVRMLARAGFRVWVPPRQGCCGAVLNHDGDREGARRQARANLGAFEAHAVTAIVSNSAGCGAQLKEYVHLLADDPDWAERAAALSARARDFAEFLAEVGLPEPATPLSLTVTYHDPCHLAHGQKVRTAPRTLIRALPGVHYVELAEADWCCGGAGSYTLLQPELSDRMLAHKVRHIRESGAQVIVTANPPCLMQIGMGLRREGRHVELLHLAELLDRAYQA